MIVSFRGRRNLVPDPQLLKLQTDPACARHTGVVQQVEAVEPGPPATHLDEPRPDLLRWRGDDDRVCKLSRRIRNQLVAGQRTIVLHRLGSAQVAFELHQEHAADEVRPGRNQPEVPREPPPRLVVGRRDAQLELDARRLLVLGDDAKRPGDLDVALLREGGEGGCVRNVHERNDRPPDLANGSRRDFARRARRAAGIQVDLGWKSGRRAEDEVVPCYQSVDREAF